MDAFIALPYLIYSLGRRWRGGEGGGGQQKQEQFKECVANEEGSFFFWGGKKTEFASGRLFWFPCKIFKKKGLIKSRTVSQIHADSPIFCNNDL